MTEPLHSLRVLNTRPQHQSAELSKNILKAGGTVIECPTLAITATDLSWLDKLPDIESTITAIFISPNAVHFALSSLTQEQISWLDHSTVIAIGQATAQALIAHKITPNEVPTQADSEHLLNISSLQNLNRQIVLLFKGEGGRKLIEESLVSRGAKIIILPVYKRELPVIEQRFTDAIWRNDLVDIILATSEQSLHNLFVLFGIEAQEWLKSKVYLVLSERLAKYAASLGIKNTIISQPEKIRETLLDYIKD